MSKNLNRAVNLYHGRKKYKIKQVSAVQGLNKHRRFYAIFDDGSHLEINTNEDVLGNKFYLTNGEGSDTIWYENVVSAVEAFLELGEKAFKK